MDYSLAEALKNAGFPQTGNGVYQPYDPGGKGNSNYVPTLEELIEACPKTFKEGTFCLTSWGKNEGWMASYREIGQYDSDSDHLRQDASTPTEAVARLFIALNPKK